MTATITTFAWVPEFARGFVRDIRPRWACEEVGQPYETKLIRDAKGPDYRRFQPFGQVPAYADDEVEIFESGAIALRIAERGRGLLPDDPAARSRAIQWLVAALNSVEPWVMQIAVVDLFEADQPWSAMRRDKVIADLDGRLADLSAALGDKAWLDGDGALRVVDAWGANVPDGKITDFKRAVDAEAGETVAFGWVEWPDKATRDAGMAKSMAAPGMQDNPPPWNGPTAIFGGFTPIFDTDH